jgi:putative colanic acid biosynthesis acetyltransferase WcaB
VVERIPVTEPAHVRLPVDLVDHAPPGRDEFAQPAEQGTDVGDMLEAGIADHEVVGIGQIRKIGERCLGETKLALVDRRADSRLQPPVQLGRRLTSVVEEVNRRIARRSPVEDQCAGRKVRPGPHLENGLAGPVHAASLDVVDNADRVVQGTVQIFGRERPWIDIPLEAMADGIGSAKDEAGRVEGTVSQRLGRVSKTPLAYDAAMGFADWRRDVFQDWTANAGGSESQLILLAFRQVARWRRGRHRPWHGPLTALYTVLVGWVLGVELPPGTVVGPGLRLLHPYAVVINADTRIGAACVIRGSTTLGNILRPDGTESGSPVIEDQVELGIGVIVIGEVRIGRGARVGAGAVVVKDVPSGSVAVGNPARVLERSAA